MLMTMIMLLLVMLLSVIGIYCTESVIFVVMLFGCTGLFFVALIADDTMNRYEKIKNREIDKKNNNGMVDAGELKKRLIDRRDCFMKSPSDETISNEAWTAGANIAAGIILAMRVVENMEKEENRTD